MPPPVKIVAGNKCDLKDDRIISSRDGLEYARKHGCGFMETSAREMVNIEETFARKLFFYVVHGIVWTLIDKGQFWFVVLLRLVDYITNVGQRMLRRILLPLRHRH